jgi:hypothetical protein
MKHDDMKHDDMKHDDMKHDDMAHGDNPSAFLSHPMLAGFVAEDAVRRLFGVRRICPARELI